MCSSKKNLNLHHKSYKNVGRETNSDVIVLCQDCHISTHKKPRWVKAKLNRQPMDFTRAPKPELKFYNMSDTLRLCQRCGEMHSVFYKQYANGKRLVMACPNSKPRITQVPFETLPTAA